jgi:predicted RNA-binding Zn-ribbon protein involved in translation (DUF1610 family)
MKTFKDFIGEYVVVRFEQDFIDICRDPSDPDTWIATGFLCVNTGNDSKYDLIFHPSQPEYKFLGAVAFGGFEEEDVNTIASTTNNFTTSHLLQANLDYMKSNNLTFQTGKSIINLPSSAVECPRCGGKLIKKIAQEPFSGKDYTIDKCQSCGWC